LALRWQQPRYYDDYAYYEPPISGRIVTCGANASGTDGVGAYAAWRFADAARIQPLFPAKKTRRPALLGFFSLPADRCQVSRYTASLNQRPCTLTGINANESTDLDNALRDGFTPSSGAFR